MNDKNLRELKKKSAEWLLMIQSVRSQARLWINVELGIGSTREVRGSANARERQDISGFAAD